MNGAVLHYGHAVAPNTRKITSGICVCLTWVQSITVTRPILRSFPASGKFTEDQKAVYESVLMAQWAVMDAMKPGVFGKICMSCPIV